MAIAERAESIRCASSRKNAGAATYWRKALSILVFGVFSATGHATEAEVWPERYRIDASHTFPSFEIDHLGFSRHRGRFNRTEGTISLDRATGRGRIDLRIDAASISTGDPKLEDILRSDAFFNTAAFPELLFRSQNLQFVDHKLTAVEGELTLLGITRPVKLVVDHFHCGLVIVGMRYVCGANASATLSRSAFGMDKYLNFGLGDEVRLTIQIEAVREVAPAPVLP